MFARLDNSKASILDHFVVFGNWEPLHKGRFAKKLHHRNGNAHGQPEPEMRRLQADRFADQKTAGFKHIMHCGQCPLNITDKMQEIEGKPGVDGLTIRNLNHAG